MVEVGTYTPVGISFGAVSPIALLVALTGLIGSFSKAKGTDVSDARWANVEEILDKLGRVAVKGG